jgi:hypothetical protein
MLKTKSLLYFLLLGLLLAPPTNADDVSLTVTGVGDNKTNAVIDAQRNALRISYGEFVSSNLTTLNNQLTKAENVNLVSGTITASKLISESVDDFTIPPMTEVLMKIKVNKGKLVSFAKAIGDDVEIQGSLFGAELQQQEINKKNEAVAMDHLAKKAEIMNAFFDYEIAVDSPKRSHVVEDDYFIYSSMSLKTNQNYKNLIMTVQNTLSQIAMTPSEIKKYDELGTPYYRLDVMEMKNPICTRLTALRGIGPFQRYYGLKTYIRDPKTEPKYGEPFVLSGRYGQNSLEDLRRDLNNDYNWHNRQNKSDITKQPGVTLDGPSFYKKYDITCTLGEVNPIFLRTKDSYRSLEKVHAQVIKSILAYELFRQTKTYKKLIFPFQPKPAMDSFPAPGTSANYTVAKSINSFIDRRPDLGDFIAKPEAYDQFIEMIVRNQPQSDKNNINKECFIYGFCYKNTEFTDYAWEINKTYPEIKRKQYIDAGYYQPSGWISDAKYIEPLSKEAIDNILEMREGREVYSRMHDVFLYLTDGTTRSTRSKKRFGLLLIYSEDFEFATLQFEDIVKKDQIASITAYSVDPDKPTK